jgi:hypothetical protein
MAIGIDEISIGYGHDHPIVITDLVRGGTIWFRGADRSEDSTSKFINGLTNRNAGATGSS